MTTTKDPKIVVIGGGTGSFTMLRALKQLTPNLTALVNMADDGGSTGVLRDEHGTLPPGDVRQCLVALSETETLRDLFNYRFESGGLEGHSFGNLFLTALEKTTGTFAQAVKTASEVLNITGAVLPITLDNVRLVLKASDGFTVRGEGKIDVMHFREHRKKPELFLEPAAHINPEARQALLDADLIVFAPGDIYTSLGPLLIVDGVAEALQQTSAVIAYVCNLVVKPGQTDDLTVTGHAAEIERFAGGPILDYVLYNNAEPQQALLRAYEASGEYLVQLDPADVFDAAHYEAIGLPLIADGKVTHNAHDKLASHRSLVRHDSQVVLAAINELIQQSL
jgi:uncharacterized cofD-like protein